jgi:hypothetical protein
MINFTISGSIHLKKALMKELDLHKDQVCAVITEDDRYDGFISVMRGVVVLVGKKSPYQHLTLPNDYEIAKDLILQHTHRLPKSEQVNHVILTWIPITPETEIPYGPLLLTRNSGRNYEAGKVHEWEADIVTLSSGRMVNIATFTHLARITGPAEAYDLPISTDQMV